MKNSSLIFGHEGHLKVLLPASVIYFVDKKLSQGSLRCPSPLDFSQSLAFLPPFYPPTALLTTSHQTNYQLIKAVLMNYVAALREGSGQMSVSVKRGNELSGSREGHTLHPRGR